jgi:type IV pilus modification protein PilV
VVERVKRGPEPGGERGFTVVEVLIALLVLLVGLAGILSLQFTSMRASSFSRHATEASVLAEDKMEDLRATPTAALADGTDTVNSRGEPGGPGLPYTRQWTIAPGAPITIDVNVTWTEQDDTKVGAGREEYVVSLKTLRMQ